MIRTVRKPAVAGAFYPADPGLLRSLIERFLAEASRRGPQPEGLIVPHAGYVYSGPIAGNAYALLTSTTGQIDRVAILGPAHYVPFAGLAASAADAFATPLGELPVDQTVMDELTRLPQVQVSEVAHQQEHSLEVQLPFLQVTLGEVPIVPLVVGQASPEEVADIVRALRATPGTLIVVSSDLSHYLDYWTAKAVDAETAQAIESLQWQVISGDRACGYAAVRGLLKEAAEEGLQVTTLDLRNSGDTAGDKRQVVGYGAFALTAGVPT